MLVGNIKQLTYSIGYKVILNNVSAEIPQGACIAIVGANGAGKSTLLSLLAKEIMPTSGFVDWLGGNPTITYFEQEQMEEGKTDWNSIETAIYRKKWNIPKQIEYAFASGGERMKMRLANAFAEGSELLLLDEPTNSLDSESLGELVEIINEGEGTYLIVSHDRYFIDKTADLIFEIEHGTLTVYKGNYSEYRKNKEMNREIQAAHYVQQQRRIVQVEKQIEQLGEWSAKAHANSTKKGGAKEYWRMKAKKKDVQIRSKSTRLEAELEKKRIAKPEEEVSVQFNVKGKRKKGHRVLELKRVQKVFGEKTLFKNVSFTIQAGERIALVGTNGSGKSTLFKMIMNEEAYEGDLWQTTGMTIGYMSQNILDLPTDMTLANYFHTETFDEQGMIRIQLKNFGFDVKQWNIPLCELSQGERVKVKLMQFILEGTDVLILDEPTNHLDLPSREEMERTLATFPGTLLFASHDRYFTERMATGLLVFREESINKFPMTLQEWEQRKKAPSQLTSRVAEERMRIETELQAVLGKLSLIQLGDPTYPKLDKEFNELKKNLRELT